MSATLDGLVKRVTVKTVPISVLLMVIFVTEMANANVTNVNVTLLTLVSLHNQTNVKHLNLAVSNMHHARNVLIMDFLMEGQ